MTDPRLQPGWKQKRYEDKHLEMLGAILGQLTALNAAIATPVVVTEPRRQRGKHVNQ